MDDIDVSLSGGETQTDKKSCPPVRITWRLYNSFGSPAGEMKSGLSCITGQVRVRSAAEEEVHQGAVPMEGSVVERAETSPA